MIEKFQKACSGFDSEVLLVVFIHENLLDHSAILQMLSQSNQNSATAKFLIDSYFFKESSLKDILPIQLLAVFSGSILLSQSDLVFHRVFIQ